MRRTWVLVLAISLSSGCAPELDGLQESCLMNVSPICNARGEALEGCAETTPTFEPCELGCTPGEGFCFECDPADSTLTCNGPGTALAGCSAEGRAVTNACMTGCEVGASVCNPCVSGSVFCDVFDLVECVEEVEQRTACEYGCLNAPAPPHCTECLAGVSQCQGDDAVDCAVDGTATRRETCDIGCVLASDFATCQICVPGTSRCDGLDVVTCNSVGTAEAIASTCPTECQESGGVATCGECVPGCVGDTLTTCSGGTPTTTTCGFGCNAAGDACNVLLPSNVGFAVALDEGISDVRIGMGATQEALLFLTDEGGRIANVDVMMGRVGSNIRDTGFGTISGIHYAHVSQSGGPYLAVWVVRSLTVGPNGHIFFASLSPDSVPAVLLVEGDVDIQGEVLATSIYLTGEGRAFYAPAGGRGGPTNTDGSGSGGGGVGAGVNGGGGGGFGSRGGTDGNNTSDRGPTYGTAALSPLLGGSGGGGSETGAASGGTGGGALQISAGGAITISGILDASGTPGFGASGHGGGGGGGSGGAILLEGATISVTGTIGAPGGGGGGGRHTGGISMNGAPWSPASGTYRSLGGSGSAVSGGDGGDGSDLSGAVGAAGDLNGDSGGGGGGAGRIRLNARTAGDVSVTGILTPSIASGIATTGVVTVR